MSDKTKILYIDIESSHNIVRTFRIGKKVFISPDDIIKERQIICVCWKWGGKGNVYSADWGWSRQSDKKLIETIVPIMKEADVVIGQNSDKFDIKYINGRAMYHGLPAASCLSTEDTLKLLRSTTYLNSYKLDYVGEYFQIGRKLHVNKQLWIDVENKNQAALSRMIKYCKRDVILTEKVYDRIAPYVKHPVSKCVIEHGHSKGCPNCAALLKYATKNGMKYTVTGRKQRWICGKCRHSFQTRLIENKQL